MPDRLQLAAPCILEQTLGLRFFEQHQSFFVDSTLADGDPQMSSSIRVNDFVAAGLTISSAHLDALDFLCNLVALEPCDSAASPEALKP